MKDNIQNNISDNMFKKFDTEHIGIIHDIQYNFYGNKLATAGSDGKINIFQVSGENKDEFTKISEMCRHGSSVFCVSWAHPRFGNLLASGSFDKKIYLWKELSKNNWEVIYQYTEHNHSINSISFCPHEYGLILLCGSSDGSISIHEYFNLSFKATVLNNAHKDGVTCLNWGPAFNPISFSTSIDKSVQAELRFVSGGIDCIVKLWKKNNAKNIFESVNIYSFSGWVRDVSWLNYLGNTNELIGACSEDGLAVILSNNLDINNNNSIELEKWSTIFEKSFGSPVWNIKWSNCGSHLAISSFENKENKVFIYKQSLNGRWDLVSKLNENGQLFNYIKSNEEEL